MTELEKLIEQKKEIEQKIKELKCQSVQTEDTRLNYKSRVSYSAGNSLDAWCIDIFTVKSDGLDFRSYKPKWVTVIITPTREEAIRRLRDLIIRLSHLYFKLTGKEWNDD